MKMVKFMVVAFVLIGISMMSMPAFGEEAQAGKAATAIAESKSVCSNPIGHTITQTASINQMRGKAARPLSKTLDILGTELPTQTDNSGQR